MFYRVVFIFMFFLSGNLLANGFENMKSFQAKFQQIITNASDKTITYEGEVFIKNNEKILWKYQSPIIKNVIVVKNIAIIDEPELEQVIYTQLQNDMNLVGLIKKAVKKSDNLYVSSLNNIEYNLHLQKNQIKKITYADELENKVEIVFNEVQQNIELGNELFEFFPPDYYDIIRQ